MFFYCNLVFLFVGDLHWFRMKWLKCSFHLKV